MATIKVKFRQSTVDGKAGTVFYQVIHLRKMARINTDIRLKPREWQMVSNPKVTGKGLSALIRNKINADLTAINGIIGTLSESGEEYSVKNIVERFKKRVFPRPHSNDDGETSFLAFMRKRIGELMEEKRYGTAANYRHTLNSFSSFVESENVSKSVTFQMITKELMERYEAWLKDCGLRRNSTSFYMRVLRATYNRAVRQGLATQGHPFSDVYMGIDKTSKRAIGEETIRQLSGIDLKDEPKLDLCKDLFLFSLSTCGMSFTDMAHLRKSNVKDGYITYSRQKTGQPMQVRLLPSMENAIRKYERKDSPYIFPVISSADNRTAYMEYRAGLAKYNRDLCRLSDRLQGQVRLTSYVARHSYATIARNHGNPASLIGKALGHTSERTTQIYLAAMDNTIVDKMNMEIMGSLGL